MGSILLDRSTTGLQLNLDTNAPLADRSADWLHPLEIGTEGNPEVVRDPDVEPEGHTVRPVDKECLADQQRTRDLPALAVMIPLSITPAPRATVKAPGAVIAHHHEMVGSDRINVAWL